MTKTDFTAEEVRNQALLCAMSFPTIAAMLDAFAERIEADESAVPQVLIEARMALENASKAVLVLKTLLRKLHLSGAATAGEIDDGIWVALRCIKATLSRPPEKPSHDFISHTHDGKPVECAPNPPLQAIQEQPGWKWVPVEPTMEMLESAQRSNEGKQLPRFSVLRTRDRKSVV